VSEKQQPNQIFIERAEHFKASFERMGQKGRKNMRCLRSRQREGLYAHMIVVTGDVDRKIAKKTTTVQNRNCTIEIGRCG